MERELQDGNLLWSVHFRYRRFGIARGHAKERKNEVHEAVELHNQRLLGGLDHLGCCAYFKELIMARTSVGDEVNVPIGLDEAVQLGTLAMGEINEKFPAALKEVVANILSFDYSGKTKREIVIKVTLTPSDDRTRADVEVGVTTKLAARTPGTTKLYFVPAGNEVVVSEDNPQQPKLEFR